MQTEVLTIDELAEYLRLPKEAVIKEADQGHLPGQKIAEQWRFLKKSIDDWLGTQSSRTLLLSKDGIWAEDDTADEMLRMIYADRGRPETAG